MTIGGNPHGRADVSPVGNGDVTVVVPVRDGAAFVADCLRSLLAQAGGAPQILVVDDGSTDETAECVRVAAPQATLLCRPQTGVSAARNAGVAAAVTPIVAFCDADDRWPPGRLVEHLSVLADPAVDAVLGHARLRSDDPSLLGPGVRSGDVALLHSFCALTIRRTAFDLVGPLDESLSIHEDYDWFLRLREAAVRLVVRPEVAFDRHLRRGSASDRAPDRSVTTLHTLKRSLDRRRAASGTPRSLPQMSDLLEHPSDESATESRRARP